MLINGCTVDKNLPAFCKAFFLPDILHELDHKFAIWKWISDMCNLPHLPQKTTERFHSVKDAMGYFFGNGDSKDTDQYTVIHSESNIDLCAQMQKWNQEVKPGLQKQFQTLCFILLGLMEIAEYSAAETDIKDLSDYLTEHDYFTARNLHIQLHGSNKPRLYYGDQMVTELPEARKQPHRELVTVAEHPHTGYLGISKDGRLVNGSAYLIPILDRRPVKVLMNQMNYVILLEDGSLVHNLRFSKLPEVPVRDVSLDGDHINWKPM